MGRCCRRWRRLYILFLLMLNTTTSTGIHKARARCCVLDVALWHDRPYRLKFCMSFPGESCAWTYLCLVNLCGCERFWMVCLLPNHLISQCDLVNLVLFDRCGVTSREQDAAA